MNYLWRVAFGRNFGERSKPAIRTSTLYQSHAAIALAELARFEQTVKARGVRWTQDELDILNSAKRFVELVIGGDAHE